MVSHLLFQVSISCVGVKSLRIFGFWSYCSLHIRPLLYLISSVACAAFILQFIRASHSLTQLHVVITVAVTSLTASRLSLFALTAVAKLTCFALSLGLQLLLRRGGYVFHTSAEKEIVRTMKEVHCYVALNPEREESLELQQHTSMKCFLIHARLLRP